MLQVRGPSETGHRIEFFQGALMYRIVKRLPVSRLTRLHEVITTTLGVGVLLVS